jgi:phosphoglycerate-specific signal transduction histidine kinase
MNNVETKRADRRWYQSIAGKLISAFVLVAALTVAATLVALLQFGNIDAVMIRLTESSLPRVKHSLAVETNAKAISASGAQLAAATSETQRFTRMSESTEQISKLWTNLSELRSIVGDTPAITRLQSLIASIDERLGQLDRAVQERIALVAARDKAINAVSQTTEALAAALAPLARPSVPNDPALVDALYQLRTDAYAAASLLYQVPAADKTDAIGRLQKAFDGVRDRLVAELSALAARGAATDQALPKAAEIVQKLIDLGSGKNGLFQIHAGE